MEYLHELHLNSIGLGLIVSILWPQIYGCQKETKYRRHCEIQYVQH